MGASQPCGRRIPREGAVNFRDIGGYPAINGKRVRWRRIFRADNLGGLTEDDRARIAGLGVRTLVDFRVASERLALPNRLDGSSGIQTVEIGFMAKGVLEMLHAVAQGTVGRAETERTFIDQYRRFVTDHAPEFRHALSYALQERHLPLLMHCTSGKDRTGFAVSALLLALGTPPEIILEDYALTNTYMRDISHYFLPSTPPNLVQLVMTAQARYLHAAFDQMRTSFGSVDAYLARALDLDDDKRAQLVSLLTDDISSGVV